jgi:hypothetical protein
MAETDELLQRAQRAIQRSQELIAQTRSFRNEYWAAMQRGGFPVRPLVEEVSQKSKPPALLSRLATPPVLGKGFVVLSMVNEDGTPVLVKIRQRVLEAIDPLSPGSMEELIERHRAQLESIASRKFNAEGADAHGVLRIVRTDLSVGWTAD